MFQLLNNDNLQVAIIGGGPGGLASAIALSALPNVEVTLYEKARELREIGAGLNIGYNSWRVLELLGARHEVNGHLIDEVQQRNGIDGALLKKRGPSALPVKYQSRRVRRTRLQRALLNQVPAGIIHLRKELTSIEDVPKGGANLKFSDGTVAFTDLVVGGDGIRSVVRQTAFPDHNIKFTGTTIWRTLVSRSLISYIPDVPTCTSWWHGTAGHVYFSPVDDPSETDEKDQLIEISARFLVDPETDNAKRWSWGVPTTNENVESHFTSYDPRVREALSKVPKDNWKEFSAFAGPRLNELHAWNKLVLIGDASHPLTGAFGSGAAFAMEDGWILARSIEYVFSTSANETSTFLKTDRLKKVVEIFDEIRSPYYARMYEHLDNMKARFAGISGTFESRLQARVSAFSEGGLDWIYQNDIERVWKDWLENKSNPTAIQEGGSFVSPSL
ncbi:monooxygenase, putative [Talaromyces stipitatus ATCC 10500]|uniref:Monooxygenase, putative n=1 Tax=Talaromyces stipitatus (strain ATCC 10500 / CBS 375.48 / QM 6759 / NRRL 1006) TaxID=441959 RepID=B8MPK6_TALSN|nr:monooxygenase, putative [Talaromyces stipitatus ATCC 10500]EED14445.1 monooxygenase, putative [Talaromyces stipitatus ATCC 10500]